jgi:hypothetical protein
MGDVAAMSNGLRERLAGYEAPQIYSGQPFAPLAEFTEPTLRQWLGQFADTEITSNGLRAFNLASAITEETWTTTLRDSLKRLAEATVSGASPYHLSDDRIQAWLAQFESDELIGFGAKVLAHLKLIGRKEFGEAVRLFVRTHTEFADAAIIAFGDAKDSGRVVAYQVQDTGLAAMDIDHALVGSGRSVIFVDDFIGSGGQAEGIIADWFGDVGSAKLGEGSRRRLNDSQIDALKDRSVGFVFGAGWSDGAERLVAAARSYGLNVKAEIGVKQMPSLFDQELGADESLRQRFCERCKEIARDLFTSLGKTWEETKIESRLLGYGNRGLLITFPNNTPTQTLTCIWQPGKYYGLDWMPLLPRRSKM